ncbi:regulator of G-protein signaling loco isoform X1 [Neodiprion virginianus]|uniref:regulator of G-protein signaling loco isoform X1 n=1 Tax=Neodiprion virginianus TaxID=2961670 RepID=UPI001EE6DB39|nr:regulator of G-protein signaling loco isoform X1 [Neodiprion virginianus]
MNMHHNRRKKKRVNYGVRVVELLRGSKGFGFTISGQQPCILSCIVQGSSADNAGLRSGDYLVAVNGHSVSKIPHDEVVRLIGNSKGFLRLQIAENYYSDSSDEEGLATVRSKPKYSHKLRTNTVTPAPVQCAIAKVVRDLHSGAMFDALNCSSQNKIQCSHASLHHRWNMASPLPPPPPPLSSRRDTEKIVHRTIVGYLGTIDIPNQLPPSSMMQVLKKCVKRLKAEKRNPTTVLLTIHVANIKLTNSDNKVIAEYPSFRIVFCNSFSELDKQYFGILTKSVKDNDNIVSNSCHVFTIYYKLIDHAVHSNTCNIFGFTCTKTSELNVCQEFPDSCNSLIGAIQTLYISDTDSESNPYNDEARHRQAASPQPSNVSTSTAHSSNSDSGIGFKDDYGNQSDRNMTADFHDRRQYLPNLHLRDSAIVSNQNNGIRPRLKPANESSGSKLTVRAVPDVRWIDDVKGSQFKDADFSYDANGKRGGINFSKIPNVGEGCGMSMASGPCGDEDRDRRGSNTCLEPSAPPIPSLGLPSTMAASSEVTREDNNIGINDALEWRENVDCSLSNEKLMLGNFTDEDLTKLSPKVYSISKSLVHSLEDLKPTMECTSLLHSHSNKSEKPRWGSLQEIRNVGNCNSNACLHRSIESFEKSSNCHGIHSWSTSFEKLLEDPAGLQTFAEFLKKEFSHENIYFWAACERYKDTEGASSRRRLAWQIYQRHLSTSASEPVNVDSHAAGQITQDLLDEAPAALFLQAQKQVFNLMKFDSYPRFLRSELYRTCMEAGSSVVRTQDCDLSLTGSPHIKLKKSHSDAEDRSRKSILPWNRKNRSKSKDRGESEYNKTPCRNETIYKSFTTIKKEVEGNNNDDNVSISSSRSSLASWDIAFRLSFNKNSVSSEGHSNNKRESPHKCTGLCRVILPDGSTTVVPTSLPESVKDVVTRLLDKRALCYSNYDVLILNTVERINLKDSSSILAGEEVQVVPTKVLKLDLPSRRMITVVARKGRTLREVLRPLLNKYGFKLETVTVWADNLIVDMDVAAINAPARLTLTSTNQEFHQDIPSLTYTDDISHSQPKLDEITNKVFKELLVSKSTNKYQYDEGSCKSEDQRSESSSILSNKFFLRDSTIHGKKKSKSKSSNTSEKNTLTDAAADVCSRPHPPLIAKWRNGVKLQLPGRYDGEDLYEGLKRAQRSRLEDQRGTEINFELPDFLKNKENGKHPGKKLRRVRGTSGHVESNTRFYDSGEDMKAATGINNFETCNFNGNDGNSKSAFHYNLAHDEGSESANHGFESMSPLEVTMVEVDQTLTENNLQPQFDIQDSSSFKPQFVAASPTKLLTPPPLPPKPKILSSGIKTVHMVARPLQKIIHDNSTTVKSCENKNIF